MRKENRRAFNIDDAIAIELFGNLDSINLDSISSKCSGFGLKNVDCSVDVNRGVMYIIGLNYDCGMPVVILECDLCGNYEVRKFGIQYHVLRSQNLALDKTKPIYISLKVLKDKNFPKYLPMYISNEFYDFVTNKVANSDLVFSSHSKLTVRDRYYNRMDAVLAKIEVLREAVHVALENDVVMMYEVHYRALKMVMVIYDLTVVEAV